MDAVRQRMAESVLVAAKDPGSTETLSGPDETGKSVRRLRTGGGSG
jgi:hypothetical protein